MWNEVNNIEYRGLNRAFSQPIHNNKPRLEPKTLWQCDNFSRYREQKPLSYNKLDSLKHVGNSDGEPFRFSWSVKAINKQFNVFNISWDCSAVYASLGLKRRRNLHYRHDQAPYLPSHTLHRKTKPEKYIYNDLHGSKYEFRTPSVNVEEVNNGNEQPFRSTIVPTLHRRHCAAVMPPGVKHGSRRVSLGTKTGESRTRACFAAESLKFTAAQYTAQSHEYTHFRIHIPSFYVAACDWTCYDHWIGVSGIISLYYGTFHVYFCVC